MPLYEGSGSFVQMVSGGDSHNTRAYSWETINLLLYRLDIYYYTYIYYIICITILFNHLCMNLNTTEN